MYKTRKVISVRYLNANEDHPLSRPHKVQRITGLDDKVHYFTMNNSRQINPTTFVTKWENPHVVTKVIQKIESKQEAIRVKFVREGGSYSRPKRIIKITTGDVVEYTYCGVKGNTKRINASEFITDWERGPQPTPKPSRKYTDEQLKAFGYSDELIASIRRNFSAKDTKLVSKNLGITNAEAREVLIKANGKRHDIYIGKITIGIKIGGNWSTIIPGDKPTRVKHNMEFHRRRAQYLQSRNKKKPTKSIQKKRAKGRF